MQQRGKIELSTFHMEKVSTISLFHTIKNETNMISQRK